MHFSARDAQGMLLVEEVIYSTGGGFIASEAEMRSPANETLRLPHPFPAVRN
jgi:L-serine dehydratase